MRRWVVVVGAAALALSGCILKDTTHTLLLEPGGAVTWVVVERNMRSDASTPAKRQAEETALLDGIQSGEHEVARALCELGASSVDVRLVRDCRPYAVWTEARFVAVDAMLEALLAELELPGTVELWREGELVHLELEASLQEDAATTTGDDGAVLSLVGDLESLEIILSEGHFVAAQGFEVAGDRAVPLPLTEEQVKANGGRVSLSLTWTGGEG
jgi:hypothetical protein